MSSSRQENSIGTVVEKLPSRLIDLIDLTHEHRPELREEMLKKAYVFALQAHGIQQRPRGTSFVEVPLMIAGILALQGAREEIVVSALLSSVLEETPCNEDSISKLFGERIRYIINQFTRIKRIIHSLHFTESAAEDILRIALLTEDNAEVLELLCADAAVASHEAAFLPTAKRARLMQLYSNVFWPLSDGLQFDFITKVLEHEIYATEWDGKSLTDLISNMKPASELVTTFRSHGWDKIKGGYDYSIVSSEDSLVAFSAEEMIEFSEMKDEEYQTLLKEAFKVIGELPAGELKRITETAKKKLEKWSPEVPRHAPELYQDRKASEALPDFLRRVYGKAGYLTGKLTTAHLDIIDPSCASAIRSWINKHGALPDDIDLPNKVDRPKGLKYKR